MSQTELQEATDNVNCYLSSNTTSSSTRKNSLLRAHLIWHITYICNALEPYSNNLWSLDQFAPCMQENCAGSLVIKYWKMGQIHSLQPHILHDCKSTVLLVAALYSCPFGHEVSSTDPRLMSQCLRCKYSLFCCTKKGS